MTFAFNLSLAGYFAALLLATANLFSRGRDRFASAATGVLAISAIAQTTYLVLRWIAAGRAPFSNMFESLVLLAWTVVVVYLALQARRKIPLLGAATALVAVLVLAYASTFESKIEPLMPALRSNWLTVHVFTCFLGYGAVTIAFLSGLGYLLATRRATAETLAAVETTTDNTISFGFLFITVGIISGAVWANSAWGTYWSWDSKETWSLITWFIYAIYLHCRFMRGWRGKRAAWIAISGFASVIFTYFGVNYLLSGLHSYAN
jgi:ABC-type transport system involved in cytochrome c biogenesis permease subunit